MTLDALGHTNLTMKKKRHNETVRYARRWLRGLFSESDSAVDTFDAAGLVGFPEIKDAVLDTKPILFPDEKDKKPDG